MIENRDSTEEQYIPIRLSIKTTPKRILVTKNAINNNLGYKQAFITSASLFAVGIILDFITKGKGVMLPKSPGNIYILLVFVTFLVFLYLFFERHRFIQWLSSVPVAIASITSIFILILCMGLIPQTGVNSQSMINRLPFNNIKHSWVLATCSFFMLLTLGLVILRRISPITPKNTGFFVNHFGLWLIIATASLGSSDIMRLRMQVFEYQRPEWRAQDEEKRYELPLAIKLIDFDIEEYSPRMAIVDIEKNELSAVYENNIMPIDSGKTLTIGNWKIEVLNFFQNSAKVENRYVKFLGEGACASAYIKVKENGQVLGEKWISAGSYIQETDIFPLTNKYALVLLRPEPKRYTSEILLYAKDGTFEKNRLEVNQPLKFKGWTIYQVGYDEVKGKWSDYSVLELVKDPWLPVVYTGLFMVLAGSLYLFWSGNKKTKCA